MYVDPEYNVLWSYSALENRMSCFNPIATNIEGMDLAHIIEHHLGDLGLEFSSHT